MRQQERHAVRRQRHRMSLLTWKFLAIAQAAP
jgi:hypothetical protein